MTEELQDIIIAHEKLIYKIASKFNTLDSKDLYQVGVIGLIKAYHNFKDDKNAKFSTYAYDYIFGEMYKFAMDNRDLKITKDTLRLCKAIEETRSKLTQALGKIPSNSDIALYLELDEELVNNIESATVAMIRLDSEFESTNDGNLYDIIPDKKTQIVDEKIDIKDSFKVLNKEEKQIIDYRYFKDFTQSETAAVLGMTQAMISRYEKKGLDKMRSYIV